MRFRPLLPSRKRSRMPTGKAFAPGRLFRRCAFGLLAAALWSLGLAGAASAQTPDIPPPAPYSPVDPRGVNLFSGTFTYSSPTIAVGPADGGLSYTATFDTAVNYWRHSVWGGVQRTPFLPGPSQAPIWTVTAMGEGAVFSEDGLGGYQIVEGAGSLTESGGQFSYTALDGTVAVFGGPSTYNRYLANEGLISSLTRPNGEVLSWTYNTDTLIQSVVSNRGYQLQFSYTTVASAPAIVVTALNNAVDACSPTANSCTFSQTWPQLTLSQTGSGAAPSERQITDSLNHTTRLFMPAGWLTGVRRPTAASGQSIALGRQINPVRYTSYDDGEGTWRYIYDIPPPPPFPPVEETYTTTVRSPLSDDTVIEIFSVESSLIVGISDYRQVRVVSVVDPLDNETTYAFNEAGALASITRPEGDIDRYTYTGRGDLETHTRQPKPGSPLASTTVTAVYGDCSTPILCGRPTAFINARGAQTDYRYAAHGGLIEATRPPPTPGEVRPQTRYAYEQRNAWYHQNGSGSISQAAAIWVPVEQSRCATLAGQTGVTPPACDGTSDEVLTITAYQVGYSGSASNILPVTVSSGDGTGTLIATTQMTYTDAGDVRTVQGPLGASDTTWTYYDAMRQPTGQIAADPDGAGARLFPATRTTFNADGQVTAVEQGTTTVQGASGMSSFAPLQTATTTYNAQARISREQSAPGTPAASLTDYGYDASGRLICTARRMNPANFGDSPTGACALTSAGAFGPDRITRNTYDAADRLTRVQTGYDSGNVLTERLQGWTDNGQVDWIEDGAGNRSDYAYDGFDRLDRLYFPVTTVGAHVASATDYEQYGYDTNDNPITKRTRSGALFTMAFDALNRITLIDAPSGSNDVWYAYDNLNRRLSASHASGTPNCATTAVCSTWDALSRLLTETTGFGAMTSEYDLAGRRIRLTWPDAFYVTYAYDLDDRMRSIKQAGVTPIIDYGYDDLGRRASATRGNGVTTTYSYDAASRLTGLGQDLAGSGSDVSFSYGYTPASQIQTLGRSNATYFYAPPPVTVGYGVNGLNQSVSAAGVTLTWSPQGNLTNDGTRTYAYDAANRLTGTGSSVLTWDPLDRLAEMTGTLGARYQYDGAEVVGVYVGGSSTVGNRLIRGPGLDELVVSYAGTTAASPLWTLQDHQSSSIAITDPGGAALYTLAYDEYGLPRPGNAGRFMYTGQMWMPDYAAYHYKARAYRPDLGRFLQTDPVGYAQGLNLYAYVGNDPVNQTDPTGMCWVACPRPVRDFIGAVATAVREDPGIIVDVVMVVADIATVPSGEALVGIAARRGARELGEVATREGGEAAVDITVSAGRHPQAAGHIRDAQAAGQPRVLTVERSGSTGRRSEAIGGQDRVQGQHLDEYPPAMTAEGGAGASVRPINPGDNMGAGACIGNQCRGLPDGTRIRIIVVD
jgi:RHS repeat-associated protein